MLTHSVCLNGTYYVYDAFSNHILSVDKTFYDIIQIFNLDNREYVLDKLCPRSYRETLNKYMDSIVSGNRESGFLGNIKDLTFSFHDDETIDHELNYNMSSITLNITEDCNLRCGYCIYSDSYQNDLGYSKRSMPLTVALKSIDYLMSHNEYADHVSLGFYGGEPFCEFDLIRKITEYFHKVNTKKESHLHITTNGTILDERIMAYLVANKVNLLISLDATKDQHNRYRVYKNGKGTYAQVIRNIKRIADYAPSYFEQKVSFNGVFVPPLELPVIRSELTSNSLLKESYSRMGWMEYSEDLPEKFNRQIKSDREDATEYYDDYYRYFKGISRGSSYDKLLSFLFVGSYLEKIIGRCTYTGCRRKRLNPNGICTPGTSKLYVDTSGRFHMCERVHNTGLIIGNYESGINREKVKQIVNDYVELCEKTCKECWIVNFCMTCFTCFNDGNGFSITGREKLCDIQRQAYHDALMIYCDFVSRDKTVFNKKIEDLNRIKDRTDRKTVISFKDE
jgi:uncharacterized protein